MNFGGKFVPHIYGVTQTLPCKVKEQCRLCPGKLEGNGDFTWQNDWGIVSVILGNLVFPQFSGLIIPLYTSLETWGRCWRGGPPGCCTGWEGPRRGRRQCWLPPRIKTLSGMCSDWTGWLCSWRTISLPTSPLILIQPRSHCQPNLVSDINNRNSPKTTENQTLGNPLFKSFKVLRY